MTLGEIKTQIDEEMDLEDEQFIESSEFTDYVNQGIREAEAEIHKLNLEDQYFLAYSSLVLVSGEGTISLPTDIYGNKIRAIQYDSSSRQYEITRFKGVKAFEKFLWGRRYGTTSSHYQYLISNIAGTGPKIEIAPVAQESGTVGKIWYIRNAKQLSADSDECDIPEFINFVLQFVRDKCANKERAQWDAPESGALAKQRQLMVDTLTEMVPDGASGEIEPDLSHYEEST